MTSKHSIVFFLLFFFFFFSFFSFFLLSNRTFLHTTQTSGSVHNHHWPTVLLQFSVYALTLFALRGRRPNLERGTDLWPLHLRQLCCFHLSLQPARGPIMDKIQNSFKPSNTIQVYTDGIEDAALAQHTTATHSAHSVAAHVQIGTHCRARASSAVSCCR